MYGVVIFFFVIGKNLVIVWYVLICSGGVKLGVSEFIEVLRMVFVIFVGTSFDRRVVIYNVRLCKNGVDVVVFLCKLFLIIVFMKVVMLKGVGLFFFCVCFRFDKTILFIVFTVRSVVFCGCYYIELLVCCVDMDFVNCLFDVF